MSTQFVNRPSRNSNKGKNTMTTQTIISKIAVTTIALTVITGALCMGSAHAAKIGAQIGVDFADAINSASGGGGAMLAADTAGVISQSNWTTVTSPGTASNLQDNSASPTTMDITGVTSIGVANPYFTGHANDGFTLSPDLKMMGDNAGVNGNGGVFIEVALAEIPYSEYNLYVYVGTDVNTNRGGSVTTDNSAVTFFYKGSNTANSYLQATETGSFTAAGTANYVLFENLTGSSLTITSEAISEQTLITGFQVVEVIPEPASLTLLGVGMLALLRRRRHQS